MQNEPASPPVNCCPAMAQPFSNCSALMGSTLTSGSANNSAKLNGSKDASNGALSKSGGPPRASGNGRRRNNKGGNLRPNAGQRNKQSRNDSSLKGQGASGDPIGGNGNKSVEKPGRHPVVKSDEFEAGSLFNVGSKKRNISHLLNFQFEPRARGGSDEHSWGHYKREKDYARVKFKKEQYLQANCQFVVRSGPDYARYLDDPDLIVDWDLIEQVHLKTAAEVPSCPICLFPPVAGKITRCGHVYCWTCMLHYLSLSDDDWRKCPICFETVCRQDLKSVVSTPWDDVKVGDEIEMSLMRRERNSLFAFAVDDYNPDMNRKHPNLSCPLTSHAQLVLANPLEIRGQILSRECDDLTRLKEELNDDPTVCYVEEAMRYLSEREVCTSFEGISVKGPEAAAAASARPRHPSTSSDGSDSVADDDLDFSSFQFYEPREGPAAAFGGARSKPKRGAAKETFYFYQASDGQPIFLHALNVEMLVAEYGSFEACPKKISGKVLEKESSSMTLALRNKLRYLRHVPVTSVFEVAEIELGEKFVAAEVLESFAAELDARKRVRSKRERKEMQREKLIKREEDKLMQKFEGARGIRIESEFHFPRVGEEVASHLLEPEGRRISESSGLSVDSTSTNPGFGMIDDGNAGGATPSFSKMLRQGVAKPRSMMKRSETFPVRKSSESEPEPEGYVAPPPKQSIGDALASALEKAKGGSAETEQLGGGSKKKNKKMKGKTISLFA